MNIDVGYPTLRESNITELGQPSRGKVRDVYRGPGGLVIVTTDRISTHDRVYGQCIPNKGFALTRTTARAFQILKKRRIPSHLISSPDPNVTYVLNANVYPVEAVVRGVLTGSGWKSYEKTGEVCGIRLPKGLRKNQTLKEPIFTPTTKAEHGHDVPITFEQLCGLVGPIAYDIRGVSLLAYNVGLEEARRHGGILADTKFEFGDCNGKLILVDEALTHDSSRFVGQEELERALEENREPHWHDKQVVRNYAESQGFTGEDGQNPPHLPDEVIAADMLALGGAYRFLAGEDIGDPPEPPTDERIRRNLKAAGLL